jgi:hypothetical protein
MMSAPKQLGNPDIATLHLLGACKWLREGEGEVVGVWKLRAGHVRFGSAGPRKVEGDARNGTGTDEKKAEGNGGNKSGEQGERERGEGREIVARGHGHAIVQHRYKRGEDGVWMFAGLNPSVIFYEGRVGKVFFGGGG